MSRLFSCPQPRGMVRYCHQISRAIPAAGGKHDVFRKNICPSQAEGLVAGGACREADGDAAGVALLLTASGKLREFEYLEREPIETDNGAREQALSMQREVLPICAKHNTIGVVLCILSVLPLFALMCVPGVPDGYYSLAVCALLLLVGIACLLLVRTGSMRGAVDKLLEQGDYTRENKAKSRFVGAVSAAYWLVVTAAFLFYTFGPKGNGQPQYSWFIWAIAGVLYGALMAALSVYRKKSK